MNPLVVQWRALPLWAKLVLLPFVISGAITVAYIAFAAIASLFVALVAIVDKVRSVINRAERRAA